MKKQIIRVIYCGLMLALASAPMAAAEPSTDDFHILLTNDDGIDAPGIAAMETALDEAGFRYTVVAPRTQQSATSMKVSTGKIAYQQLAPNRWAVDGSPADAVAIALGVFLEDDRPDLILSGANFGQNLGSNTNLSGTVGAALMGMQLGVPGIALSVGMHLAERNAEPKRFPSTLNSFAGAAQFSVRLLNALLATGTPGASLLPRHTILNVNYPALDSERIKGVRLARVARRGGFIASYVPSGRDNELKVVLEHEKRTDADLARADTQLFNAGYITVSVLAGNLDASRPAYYGLENRLGSLFGE